MDGLCILKIYTVTYFDKIVMFSQGGGGGRKSIYWNLSSFNCSQVRS